MVTGTKTPTEAALHRARTALRRAACDIGVWRKGEAHTGSRPYVQAGADALRRIDEARRGLDETRAALVAELVAAGVLAARTQKDETALGSAEGQR